MSKLDHQRIEGAFVRLSALTAGVAEQTRQAEGVVIKNNVDYLRLRKLKLIDSALSRLTLTITRAMDAQKQTARLAGTSQERIERTPSTERTLVMDLAASEDALLQHVIDNTYRELDDLESAMSVIKRHLHSL